MRDSAEWCPMQELFNYVSKLELLFSFYSEIFSTYRSFGQENHKPKVTSIKGIDFLISSKVLSDKLGVTEYIDLRRYTRRTSKLSSKSKMVKKL